MSMLPRTYDQKERFVELWVGRIERAYRSRRSKARRWEQLQRYYRGDYADVAGLWNSDAVISRIHFTITRQMAANLYYQDPSFNFVGRTMNGIKDAAIAQRVYQLERKIFGAERQERGMIDDALKYGVGILKHGWNTEYGTEPAWADKKNRGSYDNHSMGNGVSSAGSEDLNLPTGSWTEHNSNIAFGHPHTKCVKPWDFLVDADALNYEESPYCIHRFRRRWIDAIRDSRWDKHARNLLEERGAEGVSPFYIGDFESEEFLKREDDDLVDSGLVTFFEIYDKPTQTVIVISHGISCPFEIRPYPFTGKDGPYTILQFFEDDASFWGIPYMDTFTSEAIAVNKTLSRIFDHHQRWGKTRGAYSDGLIDGDSLNDMAESEDGEFVPIRLPDGMSITDVLHIFPEVPVSADAYNVAALFGDRVREISGISENDLGSGKGVQTATEASIIQQQSSLRKGDMRFCVDAALQSSARKTVALIRQFYEGDDVIPVVGEEGQVWEIPVTKQILNGAYDVDIEPGSTERVDRQARFRQSIELWRESVAAQPVLAQQGKTIDLAKLYKSILKEANIVKNPDAIVVSLQPPPPMAPGQAMPGQQGALPDPRTQSLNGGAPGPSLAAVNEQGGIPQSTGAFQNGRAHSEAYS